MYSHAQHGEEDSSDGRPSPGYSNAQLQDESITDRMSKATLQN